MRKMSQHSILDQLNEFRKRHSVREIKVASKAWNYIVSGKGKETILMMHGGTGSAESIFRYITALEKDYRVIAPTVPTDITTVREALAGIEAILQVENILTAHCIGFSMGGMLEQVFLREHPERVKTLILFHCPPPSKSYAKFMLKGLGITYILPEWLLKVIFKYRLEHEFRKYPNVPKEEKDFWVQYYLGKVSKGRIVSKGRSVNHTKIVLDYLQNYHFTANDLSYWAGKILIFETATDTMIPEVERKRLKGIYPQAQVHTFSKGDHLGNGIFLLDTTISVIKDFLTKNKEI